MFIGSIDAIPANHAGFILQLGGHQFLLTGPVQAVNTLTAHLTRGPIDDKPIEVSEIESFGGSHAAVGMGRGDGENWIEGHYLAIDAIRRLMKDNVDCGRSDWSGRRPVRTPLAIAA